MKSMAARIAISALSLLCLPLVACDKQDEPDTLTVEDEPDMGTEPSLQWYSSCGDPACSGYGGPWDGVPACGEITEGTACEVAGETCDFMSECNARLICASEDPKLAEGGCPMSRARFKQDIDYLDLAQRDTYYQELLELRLATYRYRARRDQKTQLGVILEDGADNPGAVWADPANDRVDLYGYASLAVAGVQAQADELRELRAELDALKAEMKALREQTGRCGPGPDPGPGQGPTR